MLCWSVTNEATPTSFFMSFQKSVNESVKVVEEESAGAGFGDDRFIWRVGRRDLWKMGKGGM